MKTVINTLSLAVLTLVGLAVASPAAQAQVQAQARAQAQVQVQVQGQAQAQGQVRELSLTAAVQQGAAEVYISGRGYSTGDALQLRVRKKIAGELNIKIEPGTVLVHTKANCQSMVVYGVKWQWTAQAKWAACNQIHLSANAEQTFIMEGYCRDAKLPSPKTSDYFTLAKPDEACLKVLIEGKQSDCTPKIIQAAIWIARDNVQDSFLAGNFRCNNLEIDAAKSLLQVVAETADQILDQRRATLAGIMKELNVRIEANAAAPGGLVAPGGLAGPGGIRVPGGINLGGLIGGGAIGGGAMPAEEAEVTEATQVVGPLGFLAVEVQKGQKFTVLEKADGKVLVAGLSGSVPVRGWISADKVVLRKVEAPAAGTATPGGTGAAGVAGEVNRVTEAVLEALDKVD